MSGGLVAGIDLGSTTVKMLVVGEDGTELALEQIPTPWRHGPDGTTDLPADRLHAALHRLVDGAVERLAAVTERRIDAVAVSGMGESGVLLDRTGRAVAPAFAWFDPRGGEQIAAFPAEIRTEFAGRTGLPLGAQTSAAKLAYLRDGGQRLAGLRWLNLPEFAATVLGGRPSLEASLASRTGLLDQDTGEPWPAMLAELGADDGLLAPIEPAGTDLGAVSGDFPATVAGARIAVAGHDHLVAAEADGPIRPGNYHVSMGTAEVLLRVIDEPLGYEARTRLAGRLINEVRHVADGKHVLVAGVKTGLLLRRAMQTFGITDRAGRDRLDEAVMALPYEGELPAGGLEVSGARNDDGDLAVTVRTDGAGPAEVFGAVLRHSNDEIRTLVAALDREVPPATSATLTGGWAGMRSVQRARAEVLPQLAVSGRAQETAFGAARVAAGLLPAPAH
ncbi:MULTISPECIES: FGGY-family carbohydrate kinase [Prauserella salsuginis group]|uniref:L-fuculokinase n=1 Tax=Prauserella salsuginis TaxID=387889 RepID=A0ABW6G4G1_9PSEU|nr:MULTISPECIES: FGGY family carbohydrate kinase [Prauserella salsuginis group]MCR3718188.1 Sugar (pentulose or hexulose) kinase [Prauserella flava]MCR3732758.1 Sugar (pentulose or hexulose) kinase [Prauserella salsuginis]